MFRIVFVALILFLPVGVLAFVDGFSDGDLDPAWTSFSLGTGPGVEVVNNRLEISLPGSSVDGPGLLAAGCRTVCVMDGDFDVQVDYILIDWPAASGVRVGLGQISNGDGTYHVVERIGFGIPSQDFPNEPREAYALHTNTGIQIIPASSDTGSLRLVRAGARWIGYYLEGGSWVQIADLAGTTEPIELEIAAWSHNYAFGDTDVLVAFDNFQVNSGAGCDGVVGLESTTFGALKALYR